MPKIKPSILLNFFALTFTTTVAHAGTVGQQPDAGRSSQELKGAIEPPKPSVDIKLDSSTVREVKSSTFKKTVKEIKLSGNTIYDDAKLLAIIGNLSDKTYNLEQLNQIADSISDFYRKNGYPFVKAYIPSQSEDDGVLIINIIEGRFGEIKANGIGSDAEKAQNYLTPLKTGSVINDMDFERAILLLSDLPGVRVSPLLTPSSEIGAGDLDVTVSRGKKFGGEVGIDTYGNRYTGRTRGTLDLYVNGPLTFGDQLRISSIYTEEDLFYGLINYSLPIGGSGLRANAGYSHTHYELGKEFSSLDANGTAQIANVGLSYPIIRSIFTNLTISGNYVHKKLKDDTDSFNLSFKKSSDSLPINLSFNVVDKILGNAITFGGVTWTYGDLNLDNALSAIDKTTAKSEGSFNKLNVDIGRLHYFPSNISLLARFSGQVSADNLDSSEKFGLGGIYGVRAFPSGEGFGDEGALARLELRYSRNQLMPYVFYDIGTVKYHHNNFTGSDNKRSISGAGLGLRYDTNHWAMDGTVAWRTSGGQPLSDSKDEIPVIWASAKYKF